MPSTVITSSCSSSRSGSSSSSSAVYREHREYGANKHTSTSTSRGSVIVHNHNMGVEDPAAPSPETYGSRAYTYTASSRTRR